MSAALAPILSHLRAAPSRTWSLIITLYGDAVAPRGGRLWLGTLLDVFAALDVGGNVVRTAVSRLAADGWLERNRVGRNSYYRLAGKGLATFDAAASRIYGARRLAWDGVFHLAILGADQDGGGPELRGYATLAPGVLIAPAAPSGHAVPPDATLLRASTDPAGARRLAGRVWPTIRLAEGYQRFIDTFGGLSADAAALPDLHALVARLLLIHEYRRLVLRDPMLPLAMLPEDWPGEAARDLCASLYCSLLPGSERWLDQNAMNEDGPLPPPVTPLARRFETGAIGAAQHITKEIDFGD